MQCGRYLPQVWTSAKLSTVGALEAGYYLLQPWMQLLGTFVYPIPLLLLGYSAVTAPAATFGFLGSLAGWPLMILYAVIGIAPFAVWGPIYRSRCEPTRGRAVALADGLAFAVFILSYYVTSWRALARIVRGRHGWAKTRRNAETGALRRIVPQLTTET